MCWAELPLQAVTRDSNSCATCTHFAPLSPGHAAICFFKWRGLKWNDAVPLVRKDEWCEAYELKER